MASPEPTAARTKQMPPEKPDQGYELRVDLSDHIDSAASTSSGGENTLAGGHPGGKIAGPHGELPRPSLPESV